MRRRATRERGLSRSADRSRVPALIGKVIVDQHDWTRDLSWLVSPLAAAAVLTTIAVVVVPRFITLRGGALG